MTTTSTETPATPLQPVPDALNLLKKPESNGASCCGGSSCGTN